MALPFRKPPAELEIFVGVPHNAHTVRSLSLPRVLAITAVVYCAAAMPVRAEGVPGTHFLATVNGMLADLAPASTQSAMTIRETYRPFLDFLALTDFDQIEAGLANGGLVPLPADPERFNVRVRLEGISPIGEKDLSRQASYVSARPATIGCLLDVASRVKSGPIEITSLVRSLGYQQELRVTNLNATPDVPTHTLGLAFDIAMVNTQLKTVLEIRDVLQKMSAAGDVLVIAERHQLVFHVVPQPSRLGWYSEVYAHAINGERWKRPRDARHTLTPLVTTASSSLRPMPAYAAEWWAADNVPLDVPISVYVEADLPVVDSEVVGGRRFTGYFGLFGELLSSTWRLMSPWAVG